MRSKRSVLPNGSLRLIFGLFCFALGTVMTLRSELGVSPWDVLHDGLRLNTPMSFGVATIAVGILLVVVGALAGIRPGPGTVANMVLIGVFVDLMLATKVAGGIGDGALWLRTITMLGGISVVGLGSALYIGAQLGAGPRDGLMVAIATRARMRVGLARAIVEGSALVAGILLGGQAGPGTLMFALGIGPAVDISFRLFRMDPSGATRLSRIADAVSRRSTEG